MKPVSLGRDLGSALEIREGVTPEDQVVVNPSDSLVAGMQVEVVKEK
jgi:multidrug efflux pump subunit AcrA (membrane-fusion protein)